jgi:hypothetical protein
MEITDNYKVKKWIDKVIKSCNTWDQITTAQRLVDNFKIRIGKTDYDKLIGLPLTISLDESIKNKRRTLVEKGSLITKN